MLTRRAAIIGIASALFAPTVVKAESLMRLWVPKRETLLPAGYRLSTAEIAALIKLKKSALLRIAETGCDSSYYRVARQLAERPGGMRITADEVEQYVVVSIDNILRGCGGMA